MLLYIFVGASNVRAQNNQLAPTIMPTEATSSYDGTDTVAAVRNLYARRRTGGWRYINILSGATILPAVALLLLDSNPAGLGVVGTSIGVGIGKLVRFSSKKEEAVVNAYQQGQPLPHSIRKRLRKKHFR